MSSLCGNNTVFHSNSYKFSIPMHLFWNWSRPEDVFYIIFSHNLLILSWHIMSLSKLVRSSKLQIYTFVDKKGNKSKFYVKDSIIYSKDLVSNGNNISWIHSINWGRKKNHYMQKKYQLKFSWNTINKS